MRRIWVPEIHCDRSLAFFSAVLIWLTALIGCVAYLANVQQKRHPGGGGLSLERVGALPDKDLDGDGDWTWDRNNIIAILLSVLVSLTSGPGGNGGGSFLVPLFNLLLAFSIKEAAAITACVMAFGSLTAVMCAVAERHPNHPDMTIIDYRTVMVITPPMLFGISIGVFGNEVLPSWLVTYCMIVVFSLGTYKVAGSYSSLIRKEQQPRKRASDLLPAAAGPIDRATLAAGALGAHALAGQGAGDRLLGGDTLDSGTVEASPASFPAGRAEGSAAGLIQRSSNVETDGVEGAGGLASLGGSSSALTRRASHDVEQGRSDERDVLLQAPAPEPLPSSRESDDGKVGGGSGGPAPSFHQQDGRHESTCWSRTPKRPAALLMMYVSIFVGLESFRGVQTKCTPLYWALLALEGATALVLTFLIGLPMWLESRRRDLMLATAGVADKQAPAAVDVKGVSSAYPARKALTSAEDAVQWTTARLVYMPLGMFVAGVFAGMLGLGGGFITMPLLLTLGLHPQVTAASSKVILLISTANTTASYIIADRLNLQYAIVFGMINLLVAPIGIFLMNKLIKATGKPSHLVLLTLARLGLGTVILVSMGGVARTRELFRGQVEGFNWGAMCV